MNWNDDRLDRLADQVEALRTQIEVLQRHMDKRFAAQEVRIQGSFAAQEVQIRDCLAAQNARIHDRFDRLQTSLVIALAGFLAAFVGVVLPVVF